MPSFAKSPPSLVARFAELTALVPEATRRQMFGYPTCVVEGTMFMGLHADSLILRLGEADRGELLRAAGAHIFEPMPGRPMKEYVVAPRELVESGGIEEWITRSYTYAQSLPPKKSKPAARTPAKS